ncbi:tyrosine-type recombinase/integrase [Mesorhizobium sp. M4B.F.Ca.ET.143.01.1.1]|uniref:tyrosine-type recombinase/integrase n=1 Tax=Mesorhizobium sp. M4B.F.Ca.ET.143.01.1.1 TaxID=2563947 RepID=UPI0010936A4D|nr:tyrosine-type recombinase/integrase [Mesorhizobium sp. M4B.F.Ca.ET.143.01.1.1]TGV17970.1 integrase [Mesorhizobium sp. M4B.F.Ca.ET.143.01.1.1]
MFEILFGQPCTIARYRSAPLLEERLLYLSHCECLGIKIETLRKIAFHQLDLVHILDLHDNDSSNLAKIENAFRRWSSPTERKSRPHARRRFFGHAERWMRFMGWLKESGARCHSRTREVAVFATRMASERGWADTTIDDCCRAVDSFFVWLDERGVDLSSAGISFFDQFIAHCHARGVSRSTTYLYAQRLRWFVRFAEQQGWCRPGLADGIMPPRRYPGEAIPKGLNRDEVTRLLATAEGHHPHDIRARAILMLLITYGLRAGEVSGLQLGDLDWQQEMLRVRCPKPGRTHLYPLSPDVGQAILRYLREVRPAHPERTLFLTMKAPIRPLSRGVIKGIVFTRLNDLGIKGKRRGPHALRHAAAQHLLDQGLSMKAVGDYLGHRSTAATAIYAKVNLNTLREVAEINLEGLL